MNTSENSLFTISSNINKIVLVHYGGTEALRNDFRRNLAEQIIGVEIEVNRH